MTGGAGVGPGDAGAAGGGGEERLLVVGAGPVGLAAALAIRARGHPVTVLEAEPEDRVRPGTRAIYTHRDTLERLEGLVPGLGWRIAEAGLVWHTKRTFWRGREVFSRTYPAPPPDRLPPFISLSQQDIEGYLLEACRNEGVEIRWSTPVTSVRATPSGVTVTLEEGNEVVAPYLIGADGARSTVREAIGASMEGGRSENPFIIVDVAEDPDDPLPRERIFHFEHPAVDGRNVLLVPFPGGWRVDLQCFEGDRAEDFADEEAASRWLARVLPERYAHRVTWLSTYRFLQVVADTFVDEHRRVLLVGEAAHLFAPFGARGMNSGVADADRAAEAVHRALEAHGIGDGDRARAAVTSFDQVRREAALHNRWAAGVALERMRAATPGEKVKRRAAALLSRFSDRAGAWLDRAPYGPRGAPRAEQVGRY